MKLFESGAFIIMLEWFEDVEACGDGGLKACFQDGRGEHVIGVFGWMRL